MMAKSKMFQISDALTEGQENIVMRSLHCSFELRIHTVPIKQIEIDPENPRELILSLDDLYYGISESDLHYARKSDELTSLQTIAHSIKVQGVINPIVVYKQGEQYWLVAGKRRTFASILAGKTEIQAKILDSKPNSLILSLLQWIENVERIDLTLWERIRNLEKIVTTYAQTKGISFQDVTITELSHLIGCTKPHAMHYKAVLIADDHLKALIRDNKIKNLEKAALIAGIQSKDLKQYAINACLNGAVLKKLRVIAEQEHGHAATNELPKPLIRRGRQAVSVNLGVTRNITVAKIILDSVLQNNTLSYLSHYFTNIDWNDYKALTDTFKLLLKKLEELHA